MRDSKAELSLIRRLQTNAPIDIVGIAKVMGLQVWEDQDLPAGIAGKIFRDTKNGGTLGYSIVVRAQDPFPRKRFTVAHELAHYVLHRSHFIGGSLVDDSLYRSDQSSRVEAEANGLAAELLMPWHLLLPLVESKSTEELADLFDVSDQAMRIRIESQSMALSRREPLSAR